MNPSRQPNDLEEEDRPTSLDVKLRQSLRRRVSQSISREPLYGMLADLELAASPYYLGIDYDEDCTDIDLRPY